MNISFNWLRDLAPGIEATPAELAERLAMLGAPVDEVADLAAGIDGVVVARVAEVRPHPNADRLRLCTVEAGGADPLQVVCGASNVEAGGFYPFAPVGASLPGGMAIRRAKLRGESSEGMLCSARELGLGRDHAGLMTLQGVWEPGAPLVESLGLDDVRMTVEVTANRPDLLSHVGIAREVAPDGVAGVRLPPLPGVAGASPLRRVEREGETAGARIAVEDAEGCPHYAAGIIRGVRVGPSPEWLASRLRAVGVRPINNVVDATNYVLFEVGQPLHAFDLRRLEGPDVRVRRARAGETLRTLDGVQRTLHTADLVIADATRPIALAGVMGGEDSEVTAETRDVLLECALFAPRTVRRTARRLGLSTDASYRFERGVDPELQPEALRRLIELVVVVAGGEPAGEALDVSPRPHSRATLRLRPQRVSRLLGVPLDTEELGGLLRPIGFETVTEGGDLRVTVPGFRGDVEREVDLIEEVARRRGYDSFPDALRGWRPGVVPDDGAVALEQALHALLLRWGLLEAHTPAFAPAHTRRVPLLHPLSAEESHLRDALLPGLLRRVEHNWAHAVRDVRLFEIGTAFSPTEDGGLPAEERRLALVLSGSRRPTHWSGPALDWDVWDFKALLAELARVVGGAAVQPEPTPPTPFAPGWGLRIVGSPGGEGVGGRIAQDATDPPPWAADLWGLELTLPAALPPSAREYASLPEHPPVERDLALLLPSGVTAADVEGVVRAAGGDLLETVRPFDRYTGEGIPEEVTSVAWRLRFRAAGRTLADPEVDESVARVVRRLESELGVRLRGG